MIAMLRGELYRIRKSRSFIICLSFGLLFILALTISYNFDYIQKLNQEGILASFSIEDFTVYLFSDYSVISPLLLFLIIFITSDFKQELYPVFLSKGLKRTDILWGKLLACLCATVLYLAICLVFAYTLIFATFVNIFEVRIPIFEVGIYLLIQFLSFSAYAAFVLMTCYLLRNRIIALLVNFFLLIILWLHLTKIGIALDMAYPLYHYWVVGLSNGLQIEQIPENIARIIITITLHFIIVIVVTRSVFCHFDIKNAEKGRF